MQSERDIRESNDGGLSKVEVDDKVSRQQGTLVSESCSLSAGCGGGGGQLARMVPSECELHGQPVQAVSAVRVEQGVRRNA